MLHPLHPLPHFRKHFLHQQISDAVDTTEFLLVRELFRREFPEWSAQRSYGERGNRGFEWGDRVPAPDHFTICLYCRAGRHRLYGPRKFYDGQAHAARGHER